MRFFRDLPIRRKLALLSVVTTAVALIVACGGFIAYEQITFRRTMTRNLSITAEMIAFNSAAALAFDDADSAEQTLKSLAAQPHIIAACVYNADKRVFAMYHRDDAPPAWPIAVAHHVAFTTGSLQLFRPIEVAGENIGTIYLQSDLDEINERWRRYALIVGVVMFVAILVALVIGGRLQRLISEPISLLAEAIAGVSAGGHRYAARAVKKGNDELGRLVEGFNGMLSQIEARERDLRTAHDELELRVEERTSELRVQIAERQRTEEERDRFFTLSLDLLCIAGFDGHLRRTNPAFQTILGYSPEELLTMNYIDLIHPECVEDTRTQVQKLMQGETVLNYETRVRRVDGTYRWIAWSCKPTPEGTCFYGYGRDITQRKLADAERDTLHRQLLEISRKAGMAEVATSVLHNVGNVLNSVNVSATLVVEEVRQSKFALVGQLSAMLREHEADLGSFLTTDERGRQVPQFLHKLAEHLSNEQNTVLQEVELLRKNIEHIKEIVATQQSYARVAGVVETVSVAELMDDAVQMNAASLQRHGVLLKRDYRDRPSITVEKHKVLQILVNMIRNAKHACDESGRIDKHITLQISALETGVRLAVTDNGVGIREENLTRIFSHGFTTRANGHGFGLHSGALTAQELGGSISVHSNGPGTGATFTIELPYRPRPAPVESDAQR